MGNGNESVIDYHYVIRESKVKEEVKRMIVGDKVDSDHHPVVAEEKRRR